MQRFIVPLIYPLLGQIGAPMNKCVRPLRKSNSTHQFCINHPSWCPTWHLGSRREAEAVAAGGEPQAEGAATGAEGGSALLDANGNPVAALAAAAGTVADPLKVQPQTQETQEDGDIDVTTLLCAFRFQSPLRLFLHCVGDTKAPVKETLADKPSVLQEVAELKDDMKAIMQAIKEQVLSVKGCMLLPCIAVARTEFMFMDQPKYSAQSPSDGALCADRVHRLLCTGEGVERQAHRTQVVRI